MSPALRQVGGSPALLRRLAAQSLDYVGRRVPAVWDERYDPAATDHERVYYHPGPAALRDLTPAEQVAAYFALSDHEVGGHLRFTDRAAWQAFVHRQEPHLQQLAHVLLNILEDARIERAHIERWPATRARLAWLNEHYYRASPPIRPDVPPAEALLLALNQAKFAWYYGHRPGYKGQLPPEVEAYWPEAAAWLDKARLGSTTADAVEAAEAILDAMRRRGWLDIPPDLPQRVGLSPHLDESGRPRAPGTSRPQPAPPRTQQAPAESGRQPQGSQEPPNAPEDEGSAEDDAEPPEEPEEPAEREPAPEGDEEQEECEGRDPGGTEDEAPDQDDAKEQAPNPGDAEDEAEDAGDDGGEDDGSDDEGAGDEEPDFEPDDPGEEEDGEGLGEGQNSEDSDDGGDEIDAPDAAADAERVLDEARAVLAAVEREDRDHAQAVEATVQELEELPRGLGPVAAEGLPPDLHAGVVLQVEMVDAHPVELEPLYRAMRPAGLRLAQALERLLERQRGIRRGLRRGKPDPVRIRLEELTDRVYLQRPRLSSHFDVAVLVMCDESGSMQGRRCRLAREALMMFHIALQRMGIRHAAAGFSAAYGYGQVLHRVYFGFGQSLHAGAWWHLVNGPDPALGVYTLGNARDGYSLRWGARWLTRQPEARKILIFLSDGEVNHDWTPPDARDPQAYDYGLENPRRVGPRDTRAAVREAERLGVTVIGVSIGESWGYMAEIYPRRVCCRDVAELPDALCRILLGQVAVP